MSGRGTDRIMGCEEIREALPEHLLGTLGPEDESAVRRHLRGCGACRRELAGLGEGLATFARAAHQAEPSPELRDRVLEALDEERAAAAPAPVAPRGPRPRRRRDRWLAAAAVLAILGTAGWGVGATMRASHLAGRARSYDLFLHALGGRDVRVANLRAAVDRPVEGSAVLYDSDVGRSWVLVMIRAPGTEGHARVVLVSDGGRIRLHPAEFDPEGDTDAWLVTSADISHFDRVRVYDDAGRLLASGRVTSA
jgi:Putative zinc-finger